MAYPAATRIRLRKGDPILDPLNIAALAAEPLDRLGLPWLIGGSVASSLYGIPRATLDVDLVARIEPANVPELARSWSIHFMADENMLLDAATMKRSCNLIHLDSALKIDIFVAGSDPWVDQELSNRQILQIPGLVGVSSLPFACAEDVLLHKLKWFLDADRVSDRQWGDIVGLIRVRKEFLDVDHLRRWIRHLQIPEEILDSALAGSKKP